VCDYTNIAAKDNLKNKEIQVKGWEMELDDHVDGVRIRLRPPTGLLFISRWYMSMENRDGIISTGETPDSSTRALWQAYHQSCSSKTGGTREENDEFCVSKCFLFILRSDFLHAVNSYDMGPTALLPLRRNSCCEFLSPSLSIAIGRV
jgi:hypothetical protein